MEILEAGIGRGSEGRRHTGGELGSRVLRLDPVQKFGVRAVAFHRWYQCGSLSMRMRKEDVSDARYQVQPLSLRDDRNDIRSGTGPDSVREFLWERIQEYTPKVKRFPEPIHERIFTQEGLL